MPASLARDRLAHFPDEDGEKDINPEAYKVAGWAPVAEGASGEPIWDVVARYLRAKSASRRSRHNARASSACREIPASPSLGRAPCPRYRHRGPDRAENVAFDQALIEAHNARQIPETIGSTPPGAGLAAPILSHEVRLEYCARHGIEVGRRITGGGGLYLDAGQVCWELALERERLAGGLATIAARMRRAAGLRRLGVAAEFRPRNDIEIGGRKLCGTGGVIDGRTLFFQGTLLADFDPAHDRGAARAGREARARDLDDARASSPARGARRGAAGRRDPGALLEGFRERLDLEPQWAR